MSTTVRIGCLTLALAIASAASVHAQSGNKFALGVNYTSRTAEAPTTHGSHSVGLTWRLGHSSTGWHFKYGLGWFGTDIDQSIGGEPTALGHLRVRPFMGGYGYTRVFGRTSISADVLGGYALTSLRLTPSASDAYRDRLGARSLDARAANTFVLKPEVGMWYDVTRKIGLKVSAGYMIARPHITLSSSLGDERRRIRADMLMLKAGVVYSIF